MEDKMIININLTLDSNNEECLKCIINGNTHFLSFTKEDQTNQRNFFKDTLEMAIKKPIEFKLECDDAVKNQIVRDASEQYVKYLNSELASVTNEIKKKDNA